MFEPIDTIRQRQGLCVIIGGAEQRLEYARQLDRDCTAERIQTVLVESHAFRQSLHLTQYIAKSLGLPVKRTRYDQWRVLDSILMKRPAREPNMALIVNDAHLFNDSLFNTILSIWNSQPLIERPYIPMQIALLGTRALQDILINSKDSTLMSLKSRVWRWKVLTEADYPGAGGRETQ